MPKMCIITVLLHERGIYMINYQFKNLEKHQKYIEQQQKKEEYIQKRAKQYYHVVMDITNGDIELAINTLHAKLDMIKERYLAEDVAAVMRAISILQWEAQKQHGELMSIKDNEPSNFELYGDLMTKLNEKRAKKYARLKK